jgi:hypothetical protein
MKRKIISWSIFGVMLLGLCWTVLAQKPGDPKNAPNQLPVETQNEVLKLELHQQQIQSDFNACNLKMQSAQKDFSDDQTKIDKAELDALRKMGFDPDKMLVQRDTFYITAKPEPKPLTTPDKGIK